MVPKKTITLLHGFGEDHRVFDAQVQALSEKYNVFAPDLPGSGILSKHQWQPGTQSIEWLAHWVNGQLAERQIPSCIMLGHSMGGYITLAFAEKYPDKLSAFGLVHSTAFEDPEAKKANRLKAIQFMQEKGPHAFLKTAIPGLFGTRFSQHEPQQVADLVEKAKAFELESLTAYYRAMIARPDRTAVLKNATMPVLLVAGAADMAAPLPDLLQQAPMPTLCHFHILKHSGHMGMMEEPENLSKILLNFSGSV